MSNFITKAALAAIVVLGAFGAAAQANAANVDVNIHVRHPHVAQKPFHPNSKVVFVRPGAGRCAPPLALQKAESRGLHRATISHIGPKRVVVSGKVRGGWAKMSFANVRGCPRL